MNVNVKDCEQCGSRLYQEPGGDEIRPWFSWTTRVPHSTADCMLELRGLGLKAVEQRVEVEAERDKARRVAERRADRAGCIAEILHCISVAPEDAELFLVSVRGSDASAAMRAFMTLIHHATHVGHSGLFAVPLDGDGDARVTVCPSPDPALRALANRVSAAAVDVEIAGCGSFRGERLDRSRKVWLVTPKKPEGEWV